MLREKVSLGMVKHLAKAMRVKVGDRAGQTGAKHPSFCQIQAR